jgi:hypothetical protein
LLAIVLTVAACGATTVAGTYYAGDESALGTTIELSKDGSCKINSPDTTTACAYEINGTQIVLRVPASTTGLKPEYRGVLSMNRQTLMLEKVTWERAG